MAGSNGNGMHMNEDELLASLDFEQMSPSQKERYERIIKVNRLAPYHTNEQIADKLGVALRTIERDRQFIKRFIADKWVNDLAHRGYGQMSMDFATRNEESLRKLYTAREAYDPTNSEELPQFLSIQGEIDRIESMLMEITGAGPALKSMKDATKKSEMLKE